MPLLKMFLQFWGELRRRKPSHAVFNHSAAEVPSGGCQGSVEHGLPVLPMAFPLLRASLASCLLLWAVICTRDVKFPGARQQAPSSPLCSATREAEACGRGYTSLSQSLGALKLMLNERKWKQESFLKKLGLVPDGTDRLKQCVIYLGNRKPRATGTISH